MRKLNILLADDIDSWLLFNQENLQKFLANFDVSYYMFQSATDAYNFALNFDEKIDIVLTDLQMESMEKHAGEWLIENLKTIKSARDAKFIILSSSYDISFVADRAGADGFLRKQNYHSNPLSLKYQLEEILGAL